MELLHKLKHHAPRIRHQLGEPLRLGGRGYQLQGYHPDRLVYELCDEPYLVPVIDRVLKLREGAFIDVGANLGQTLFKLLKVDSNRTYVGFEPQLACCFYIEQFLQHNGLKQASIVPSALSNVNGMVQLFWDMPNDTTASIAQAAHYYAPYQPRPHASWVPGRVGDEVFDEMGIDEIALIKIDVEGFELEVVEGLKRTLSEKRPVVIFEVLSNYFWNQLVDEKIRALKSQRARDLFLTFYRSGYDIYRIDRNGDEHQIGGFDLDAPPASPQHEERDYIARSRA